MSALTRGFWQSDFEWKLCLFMYILIIQKKPPEHKVFQGALKNGTAYILLVTGKYLKVGNLHFQLKPLSFLNSFLLTYSKFQFYKFIFNVL